MKILLAALMIVVGLTAAPLALAQEPDIQLRLADEVGLWRTVTWNGSYAYAGNADKACQIQHQEFNANATYQEPTYANEREMQCNWIARQFGGPDNSNTILPSTVRLICGPGGDVSGGECVYGKTEENVCQRGAASISAPDTPQAGNPISVTSGYKVLAERDYATSDGLLSVDRSFLSRPGDGWKLLIPAYLEVDATADKISLHCAAGGYDDFRPASSAISSWDFVPVNAYGHQETTSRRRLSMVTTPSVDRPTYFTDTTVSGTGPAEMRLDMADGAYTLFRRVNIIGPLSGMRLLAPVEQGTADGYKRWFDYNDDGPFPFRVRDSFNRQMTLTWSNVEGADIYPTIPFKLQKVISEIGLPDGTKLEYTYDRFASNFAFPVPGWAVSQGLDVRGVSSGSIQIVISGPKNRLRSVTRRSAANAILWMRSYDYANGIHPNDMTAIRDQNGAVLASYTYAGSGRLATSQLAGGVNLHSFGHYDVLKWGSPDPRQQLRRITGPLGRTDDYLLYRRENAARMEPWAISTIEGQATTTTPADTRSFSYDSSSGIRLLKSGVTDARGYTTSYTNDTDKGRPITITQAAGTAQALATNIQWHTVFDLPLQVDDPGLRINYSYSATGQLLSRTLTDTTTHTLPYPTAGQTRTETYGWTTGGRLASINGPRAAVGSLDDITSFAYDAAGNLLTMTDALGHVTSFAGYDANGRPGSMTDVNGVVTQFAYDALGRLLTSNRKHPTAPTLDAITTYEYDIEGRVKGITLPATQKMIFTYDLAGQLFEVASADGEKWVVTRDAMGNITQEKTKTAAGTDRSTITRTFDALGRMLTETLGAGRTTAWQYDKNGNPIRTTSPRSHATDMAFDPLNRLVSTLAPDSGTTATGYDAMGDLQSFTDAAAVQTTFVRNGFGEVIQEASPDRGTSVYHHDAAGDVSAVIDGRGQRIDYTRDILGRVTTKTPVGRPSSEIVSYAYDTGGFGSACYCVGRLAKITDATGVTKFAYDHRGNMTAKVPPVGSLTWNYDLADRIYQVRYQGGRDVYYTRDNKGRVTQVKTRATTASPWVTLADNFQYEPFGALKSVDFANGLKLAQDWGSDARLASKRLYRASTGADVWRVAYSYDNDDNITAINDLVTPANSLSFGYDSVDRLVRMDGGGGSFARQDYLHDANGNRTAAERRVNVGDATAAESDTYARTSGTNRLASVTLPTGTRGFTHDARGNLIGETLPGGGSVTLTYDGHARLASYAATGSPSQAMTYNGLDERTKMVTTPWGGGTSDTRHFSYDQGHRINGEYGATASDVRAIYIWLLPEVGGASAFGGDDGLGGYMPLAVALPSGGGSTVYWVQGNHIGTPVAITDASGAVVNPGGFSMAGFPGQVQQQAELYYNYYRDYDVSLGRYVQADPIGLGGDENPYLYALGNPLRYTDPTGEFGLPGAVGSAGFNFVVQVGRNYWITGDLWTSVKCVDYMDVAISAGAGFLGPTAWGNIIRNGPNPWGLTRQQSAVSYFSTFLPGSAVAKWTLPSWRLGGDCECGELGGGMSSGLAH